MTVFSPQEQARIEACIGDVEKRTAAEIVVVTRTRCDRYLDVRWSAAAASAVLAAALAHFVWPQLSISSVLALQLLVAALVWPLSGTRRALRRLVPSERRQRAVERACELEFLQHAVFDTRDRVGVLILLSELEQRVAILGDKGIHARVEQQGWSALVKHMVDAIHAGRSCDGVCEVVMRLGETLALCAPVQADDANELSNKVQHRSEL